MRMLVAVPILGLGWLIVDLIQSKSREHFPEEPYFIGGTRSNIEEQRWLEEAEQKWLIAQSTATPFGTELVYSYPITAQMAMIASEQGYGNIMDRPQPEREAIYRQAAPLANTASVPESSAWKELDQMEMILDTGFQLKCVVAEMSDTERDIISQKYYEVVSSISSWIPADWKAEIKKTFGWDLDRSDPKLLRAIACYQRFLYAALDLNPTLSADDIKKEFGNLWGRGFPKSLDNYLRFQRTNLFHAVDFGIADGYKMRRSTVYKSNLFGYGMHAPGSNAANAIPVHSQLEEDSFPAGAWLMDSPGRSHQKREPQTQYF
jgi:hypothetical protein